MANYMKEVVLDDWRSRSLNTESARVLDVVPLPIFFMDAENWKPLFMNSAGLQFYGKKHVDELDWSDASPGLRAHAKMVFRSFLEEGKPRNSVDVIPDIMLYPGGQPRLCTTGEFVVMFDGVARLGVIISDSKLVRKEEPPPPTSACPPPTHCSAAPSAPAAESSHDGTLVGPQADSESSAASETPTIAASSLSEVQVKQATNDASEKPADSEVEDGSDKDEHSDAVGSQARNPHRQQDAGNINFDMSSLFACAFYSTARHFLYSLDGKSLLAQNLRARLWRAGAIAHSALRDRTRKLPMSIHFSLESRDRLRDILGRARRKELRPGQVLVRATIQRPPMTYQTYDEDGHISEYSPTLVGGKYWSYVEICVGRGTRDASYFFVVREEDISDIMQMQQELQRARTRGELVGLLSHEIRTPLNGLLGMLQHLASSHMPQELEMTLRYALMSARSLSQSVNEVFDLNCGAFDVQLSEIGYGEVVEMLEEIAALLAVPARGKGVQFVMDLCVPVGEARVWTDLNRLRQLVFSLGSDAVEHTRSGSVRVTIDVVGPQRHKEGGGGGEEGRSNNNNSEGGGGVGVENSKGGGGGRSSGSNRSVVEGAWCRCCSSKMDDGATRRPRKWSESSVDNDSLPDTPGSSLEGVRSDGCQSSLSNDEETGRAAGSEAAGDQDTGVKLPSKISGVISSIGLSQALSGKAEGDEEMEIEESTPRPKNDDDLVSENFTTPATASPCADTGASSSSHMSSRSRNHRAGGTLSIEVDIPTRDASLSGDSTTLDPHGWLVVEVIDTGSLITDRRQQGPASGVVTIFDQSAQGSEHQSLRLSIAAELAHRFGGQVTFESEQGVGTKVRFVGPLRASNWSGFEEAGKELERDGRYERRTARSEEGGGGDLSMSERGGAGGEESKEDQDEDVGHKRKHSSAVMDTDGALFVRRTSPKNPTPPSSAQRSQSFSASPSARSWGTDGVFHGYLHADCGGMSPFSILIVAPSLDILPPRLLALMCRDGRSVFFSSSNPAVSSAAPAPTAVAGLSSSSSASATLTATNVSYSHNSISISTGVMGPSSTPTSTASVARSNSALSAASIARSAVLLGCDPVCYQQQGGGWSGKAPRVFDLALVDDAGPDDSGLGPAAVVSLCGQVRLIARRVGVMAPLQRLDVIQSYVSSSRSEVGVTSVSDFVSLPLLPSMMMRVLEGRNERKAASRFASTASRLSTSGSHVIVGSASSAHSHVSMSRVVPSPRALSAKMMVSRDHLHVVVSQDARRLAVSDKHIFGRVLYAEDIPLNQMVLRRLLKDTGR